VIGTQGSSNSPLEIDGHALKGILVINILKSLGLFSHMGTDAY
jgi:hypothetical protein